MGSGLEGARLWEVCGGLLAGRPGKHASPGEVSGKRPFLTAWLGEPGLPPCTGSYGAAGPVPCPLLAPADSCSLLQADLGTHEGLYLFECVTENRSGRTW